MNALASIVETNSFTFTWDLDIDTNDTATNLRLPLQTRFGELLLEVTVTSPQAVSPTLRLPTVEPCSIARNVKPRAELYWLDAEGRATLINRALWATPHDFPSAVRGQSGYAYLGWTPAHLEKAEAIDDRFDRFFHRRFRFVFAVIDGLAPAATLHTILPRHIKANTCSYIHSKRPQDVRLFFPDLNAELWENSSFLSASSPYFKTLLASDDFVESVRRGRKRPKIEEEEVLVVDGASRAGSRANSTTPSEAEARHGGGDDSDEETDDFIKRRSPPSVEDDSDDVDFTYREVKISQTPYSTYRAVLLYLHSGHITFAPLFSTFFPSNPEAKQTHEQLLAKHLDSTPALPFPVSPKSIYRLAHLLEIPSLCALSLAEIESQISVDNAAFELFSSISIYDHPRELLLDFVVAHWKEIKPSKGMKVVEAKVKAGELPSAGAVYAELLPRLA